MVQRRRSLVSYAGTPSGGTIVLLAVGAFLLASAASAVVARARRAAHDRADGTTTSTAWLRDPVVDHGDHVDYVHDGHRHAAHEGHYDEHGQHAEVEPR